jgi:tRNA A37 threonylcarbamoyladenosine biosynthesis protein TsaE
MIYKKEFICKTENDTKKLAENFAKIAQKGDIFALFGTLGVGKSCFSRYFIKSIVDGLLTICFSQTKSL